MDDTFTQLSLAIGDIADRVDGKIDKGTTVIIDTDIIRKMMNSAATIVKEIGERSGGRATISNPSRCRYDCLE